MDQSVQKSNSSQESFNLDQKTIDGDREGFTNLSKNLITFDFESLQPVQERIKLEGDEYEATGKHRRNKDVTS
jgi:hypothetical protein